MATRVPAGATVSRVYFTVPYFTGYGTEKDTHDEAVTEARKRKDLGWEQNRMNNRVFIEERWMVTWPGGGVDLVIERTECFPHETREEWQRWVAKRDAAPDTGGQ